MYPDWSNPGSADIAYSGFAGHLGSANYLFADGHVKSLRPTQTGTPINMWGAMSDNNPGTDCTEGTFTGKDAFKNPYAGINCDQVSPGQLAGLKGLEDKYK